MKTYFAPLSLLIFICVMPGHERPLYGSNVDEAPPVVPCPDPAVKVPVVSCPDPPPPIVSLKVRVPAFATQGKNLEYRLIVENKSPSPAHNVIIHDKLPANVRYVTASPLPHGKEPELQWRLGTLHGNGCLEIRLIVQVPKTGCDIANCFRVTFEHGVCVTTRLAGFPPTEPLPFPPTKEPIEKEPKKTPIKPVGKLRLSMSGPKQQGVGEPTSYTVTVANEGPVKATNVLVETQFPKQLQFVSASHKGLEQAGQVGWTIGNLEPGTSRTLEVTFKTTAKGKWCLKSHARADGGLVSGEEEICTNFVADVSALLLEMYDTEDPINVGGTTRYTIYVLNQGFVPVTNLRIDGTLPPGLELVSARGQKYRAQGKQISFEPAGPLAPGAKAEYEVVVRATAAGEQRFRIAMTADQLKTTGPIHEEESTMVYDEEGPPFRVQTQSRQRTKRIIPLDAP